MGDDLESRPLVLMLFGGSYIGGSRTSPDIVEICTRYAKMGYVAAAIDYRLTTELLFFLYFSYFYRPFTPRLVHNIQYR